MQDDLTITIRAAARTGRQAEYQVWAGCGRAACRLGIERHFRSRADALDAARRLARRTGWRIEESMQDTRRTA